VAETRPAIRSIRAEPQPAVVHVGLICVVVPMQGCVRPDAIPGDYPPDQRAQKLAARGVLRFGDYRHESDSARLPTRRIAGRE
jgi:hypothetical protein